MIELMPLKGDLEDASSTAFRTLPTPPNGWNIAFLNQDPQPLETAMSRGIHHRRCRPTVAVLEDRTLLDAGDLDPTFGNGGIVDVARIGTQYDEAEAVAVRPDGEVLVAGSSYILRFDQDGQIDSAFGKEGVVELKDPNDQSFYVHYMGLAVYGNKTYAVGTAHHQSGKDRLAVVRLDDSGRLDLTFAGDGIFEMNVDGQATSATGVAVAADGKIVVVGHTARTDGSDRFVILRLGTDGTPDSVFNSKSLHALDDLRILDDFQTGGDYHRFESIKIQPWDGSIVVAGTSATSSVYAFYASFCAARILPSGELDLNQA